MAFGSTVEKTLELIAAWQDSGYTRGVMDARKRAELFKKAVRDLIKTIAGIAAAAAAGAAALLKMIQAGAEVKSVGDSFYGFLEAANMAPDTLERIRDSLQRTVSDMDIMQSSIRALSGGLDPGRLIEFWEKAKQIADVSSRDTVEVFDSLALSLNKVETQTLEAIGITIKMDEAVKKYADSIGKKQDALTLHDRQMAFSIALEEKYQENFRSVGDVTTRVREKFQQLKTSAINLKDAFFQAVAESPRVQEFLSSLIKRLEELRGELDDNRDVIGEVVDKILLLLDRFIELTDKIKTAGETVEKFQAPLMGLGAGIVGAKIGGWVGAILAATGVISGGTIPLIAGLVALVAGLGTTAVVSFRKMQDAAQEETDATASGLERILALYEEIEKAKAEGKPMSLSEFAALPEKYGLLPGGGGGGGGSSAGGGDETRTPGGSWSYIPEPSAAVTPILPEDYGPQPPKEDELAKLTAEEEAYLELQNTKVQAAEETAEALGDIDEARTERSAFLQAIELDNWRRNLDARREAYAKGFQVMSYYGQKFYEHGAKMNRVLAAMAIAGFSEMVASYIEAKTEQARFDAMEGAYQTLKYLAQGNFYAAGLMAQATAGAAAIAGIGIVAAGAIRSWGAGKAESYVEEEEPGFDDLDLEGGESDRTRTKREASGVVQQRPIRIFINTTVSLQTGIAIFGEDEAGIEEFYEGRIRGYIQDDLERGVLEAS